MLAATDQRPSGWLDSVSVQVLAADGITPLYGVLFTPPKVQPGQRFPLIDHIYGGPQVAHVPRSINGQSYLNSASLAELGFYVLVLDGRGTALRGRAFREYAYGQSEKVSDIADHQAAIRQLAERWPIDLNWIGIYGFSGGGYMAASAVLRAGDFFKVAVAWAGNHDQRLFWHGWGERYQGLLAVTIIKRRPIRNMRQDSAVSCC